MPKNRVCMQEDREIHWAGLMRAANRGDGAAYHQFLDGLVPPLRAMARRGLARAGLDPGEAEDVVQEALLAIHLKRHTWREDEPIGPWVGAICRYKLVDALRRRGRRGEVPIEDLLETLAGAPAEDGLVHRDVERAVARLPGRMAEVVRAISVDGASITETAGRLGISEGAVRVALHRGLAALSATYGGVKE